MKNIFNYRQQIIMLLLFVTLHTMVYAQSGVKPNIIFILADDLGYGDLKAFNPHSQIPAPHLNKLAEEGIIFTDAHSPSSVCSPTRYGILTGRYAFRSALKGGVLNGYSPSLIEIGRLTVADLLKTTGYHTAVIGKWHLGFNWAPLDASKPAIQRTGKNDVDMSNVDFSSPLVDGPNQHGFDYSYVLPASLDMAPYAFVENGKLTDLPLIPVEEENKERGVFWRGGHIAKDFKIENTLQEIVNQAEKYLEQRSEDQEQPFFLYLPITAPHTPWLPPNGFVDKSETGKYGAFVTYTDSLLGSLFSTLDHLRLTNNTLIVFASDNGADWKQGDREKYPEHSPNYIFRGGKSEIWEGGHRVPLIINWRGTLPKGKKKPNTVGLIDLMATVAGLTNMTLPRDAAPDSYNLWPLISSQKNVERKHLIHHSSKGIFAIRQGPWKFIDSDGGGGWSNVKEEALGQLYNLEEDIEERINLYYEQPDIVKELKTEMEKIKEQGYSIIHD